ncbi:hypothetical protein [Streptomyces asiaticus]|uniref:hypothetical protein n=1 Tax=Streptomyces asiaticus TaxID=114695 RepID=UPI003814FA75
MEQADSEVAQGGRDAGQAVDTDFRGVLTEVYFADTADALGPLGAKSMSESPFLLVAAALANAVRDATGVRLGTMPMTRDRVCLAIAASRGTPVAPDEVRADGPVGHAPA